MTKISDFLKENKSKLICIYINLLYIYYIFQLSQLNESYLKLILLITYLLFPFVLIAKHINLKKIIMIGILCIFGYTITHFDSRYLTIITIFFALWEEDISYLFKPLFIVSTLALFLSILIGIDHINGLCVGLGLITYLLFLSNILKGLNVYTCIGILINIFLFGFIRSGQAIVCINFCFIFLLLLKKYQSGLFFKSRLWICSFFMCSFLNIYLALSTHNYGLLYLNKFLPNSFNLFIDSFLNKLDSLLSYRLSLSNVSLNLFGFKLYGNALNPDHPRLIGSYFNVDSGYLQILQCQGLIIFLFILIILMLIMLYFYRVGRWDLIVIGFTIALWGINEDILVSLVGNILWLFLPQSVNYIRNNYIIKRRKICTQRFQN